MILLVLLICCIFAACKKDSGSHWVVPKIRTITTEAGSTTSYYYDSEGRISYTDDGVYKLEFTYEPSRVIQKITEYASGGIVTSLYELNTEGYASKNGNSTYSYTPEGYRKSVVNVSGGSPAQFHQYYYSASGLLDSVVLLKGSVWTQTTVYSYYTDKNETTGNENSGYIFFGKSQPHPVKTVTYWRPRQGFPEREVWRTENYSYLYDAVNRIVKSSVSVVSYGQGSSFTNIYTYY